MIARRPPHIRRLGGWQTSCITRNRRGANDVIATEQTIKKHRKMSKLRSVKLLGGDHFRYSQLSFWRHQQHTGQFKTFTVKG